MKTLLLVDDDDAFREAMAEFFSTVGYAVHEARDRDESRALLATYNYDLVITDLGLSAGQLDGLDVIETVHDSACAPRIIALSGAATDLAKQSAEQKGADVFIQKPKPLSELARIAAELLDRPHKPKPVCGSVHSGTQLLAKLLVQGSLRSFVQPIFRLGASRNELVALELLTRGPAGTPFASPDALFAYARLSRTEARLDMSCITQGLRATAGLLNKDINISFNVHASTLGRTPEFAVWLRDQAEHCGIPTERLTAEIVEHAPAWNKTAFLSVLDELRRLGVRIAIDDVGQGNSNFSMIVDARPNYLKLDRYFGDGCSQDPIRRSVVASVATLAKGLDAEVVAEGVHAPEDLEVLRISGIELVQSFAFCPPLPLVAQSSGPIRAGSCALHTIQQNDCPLRSGGLCTVDPSTATTASTTSFA